MDNSLFDSFFGFRVVDNRRARSNQTLLLIFPNREIIFAIANLKNKAYSLICFEKTSKRNREFLLPEEKA